MAGALAQRRPAVLFATGSSNQAACALLREQVAQFSRDSGVALATAMLSGGPDLSRALAELADALAAAPTGAPLGNSPWISGDPVAAGDPLVIPFLVADGVLRDRMVSATRAAGLRLAPGSLTTSRVVAELVAELAARAITGPRAALATIG